MEKEELPAKIIKSKKLMSAGDVFYKYVSDAYMHIVGATPSHEREEVSTFEALWEFPESRLTDDIADLKQIALDIARKNQRIIELLSNVPNINSELSEIKTLIKTKIGEVNVEFAGFNQTIQEYVGLLEGIEIAKQIYLFKSGGCNNLWTIINAPPFEDELRYPIYEAQMNIVSRGSKDNPIDFYILNINEIPEGKRLEDVLPVNATVIWKRE